MCTILCRSLSALNEHYDILLLFILSFRSWHRLHTFFLDRQRWKCTKAVQRRPYTPEGEPTGHVFITT